MQMRFPQLVWAAGVVVAAALAPAARAQAPGRVMPVATPQPASVVVPRFTSIQLATTVTVPDGGTASLGGYSRLSEGRTQYGAPILGRVPFVGRGFGNVGYGRSAVSSRVTASVRIISLQEEEYRQTGVRSP
jgi:type II secretory pathway component GspD/PulD (secretin)